MFAPRPCAHLIGFIGKVCRKLVMSGVIVELAVRTDEHQSVKSCHAVPISLAT